MVWMAVCAYLDATEHMRGCTFLGDAHKFRMGEANKAFVGAYIVKKHKACEGRGILLK